MVNFLRILPFSCSYRYLFAIFRSFSALATHGSRNAFSSSTVMSCRRRPPHFLFCSAVLLIRWQISFCILRIVAILTPSDSPMPALVSPCCLGSKTLSPVRSSLAVFACLTRRIASCYISVVSCAGRAMACLPPWRKSVAENDCRHSVY
jgi:hypothetical protein